jgi:hypothetical protein
VDRLMAIDSNIPLSRRGGMVSWNPFLVFVAFAAFLLLLPEVLYPIHRLLESLLH